MATYRIGHLADMHWPGGVLESNYETDWNHLWNNLNADTVIWGGDQISGGASNTIHAKEQDIRDFWEKVESVDITLLENSYSIPGNHDLPVPHYNNITNDYLDGREKTPRKLTPIDGLTILNISTQGGSNVDGGVSGVGMDYPYIPLRELKWLIDEVKEAHNRRDIILIFGHTPIWYGTNSNVRAYNKDAGTNNITELSVNTPNAGYGKRSIYFMINNFWQVMEQLTANSPVCYFPGDDKHGYNHNGSANFYDNINGVYQAWQDHYGYEGGTNYAYIDVDTSTGNVKFVTVASDANTNVTPGTETTVMDVTPSW